MVRCCSTVGRHACDGSPEVEHRPACRSNCQQGSSTQGPWCSSTRASTKVRRGRTQQLRAVLPLPLPSSARAAPTCALRPRAHCAHVRAGFGPAKYERLHVHSGAAPGLAAVELVGAPDADKCRRLAAELARPVSPCGTAGGASGGHGCPPLLQASHTRALRWRGQRPAAAPALHAAPCAGRAPRLAGQPLTRCATWAMCARVCVTAPAAGRPHRPHGLLCCQPVPRHGRGRWCGAAHGAAGASAQAVQHALEPGVLGHCVGGASRLRACRECSLASSIQWGWLC